MVRAGGHAWVGAMREDGVWVGAARGRFRAYLLRVPDLLVVSALGEELLEDGVQGGSELVQDELAQVDVEIHAQPRLAECLRPSVAAKILAVEHELDGEQLVRVGVVRVRDREEDRAAVEKPAHEAQLDQALCRCGLESP